MQHRSEFQYKVLKDTTLDELREHGFIYHKFYPALEQKFETLQSKRRPLHDGIVLSKSTSYSQLASCFFPHMFSTRVDGMKTPLEAWEDDVLLAKAYDKALKYNVRPRVSAMRTYIQIMTGVQSVSNFRPEIAKAVYEHLAPGGRIYDPSMGYGGRLVGFMASSCIEYIGVDVNSLHFSPLNLYEDVVSAYEHLTPPKTYGFFQKPAEEFVYRDNYFDLAFTSPPYFNREQYSNDPEQSYLRYPALDSWLDGFLKPMVNNVYRQLKPNGFFALNIRNLPDKKGVIDLETPFLEIAKSAGFTYRESYRMQLSAQMGTKHLHADERKYEPIFVFSKSENT